MKRKHSQKKLRDRRGTLLARTQDSVVVLKRVFSRMMTKATEQGEIKLLQRIFSY